MSYNEKLAEKIRASLEGTKNLTEKKMFGGIVFMINDKICVGVDKNDMIIRCEPEMTNELLSKPNVIPFDLTARPMKGWLLISEDGISTKKNFDYWVQIAVVTNEKVATKKKNKSR
jgi:TfoX/Sxy family transcriptional regulator of competence genes